MCVWPGKPKRSGDWGKEEHIRAQLNIERQQISQPPKINNKCWTKRSTDLVHCILRSGQFGGEISLGPLEKPLEIADSVLCPHKKLPISG